MQWWESEVSFLRLWWSSFMIPNTGSRSHRHCLALDSLCLPPHTRSLHHTQSRTRSRSQLIIQFGWLMENAGMWDVAYCLSHASAHTKESGKTTVPRHQFSTRRLMNRQWRMVSITRHFSSPLIVLLLFLLQNPDMLLRRDCPLVDRQGNTALKILVRSYAIHRVLLSEEP